MKNFRWLALVTVVAVYLQVVLGSVVRITGSGLGCRDWPLCYQHETDRFAYRTLLEVAHRVLGTAGGALVLATAVLAVILYRRREADGFPRGLRMAALIALGLYCLQGVLGGVTVLMKNSPFTVAIHLANAELVLGMTILVALWAARVRRGAGGLRTADQGARRLVAGSVGAYLVLVTGAVVVGTGASGACASWPLCGSSGGLADTHMLHRLVVLGGSVAILAAAQVAARRWRGGPLGSAAYLTVGLLLAEVLVGAAQVLAGLPPALRSIHVALASAVWSGTALLACAAWLERAGSEPAPALTGPARMTSAEARG
jgi:heme A synthase